MSTLRCKFVVPYLLVLAVPYLLSSASWFYLVGMVGLMLEQGGRGWGGGVDWGLRTPKGILGQILHSIMIFADYFYKDIDTYIRWT